MIGNRDTATRTCLALGIAIALMAGTAWGYWSPGAGSAGAGASSAAVLSQGATPTATVDDAEVDLSWAATSVTPGQPVTGYLVHRFDAATLNQVSISAGCAGTVTTTSCTENNVPDGQWRYSVTPTLGTYWMGAESSKSDVVTVDSAAGGPQLGAAKSFSVLGGTAVTSTGATTVSGDLGVSPSSSVVGFPPGVVGGTIHAGDAPAAAAQLALVAAYNDAASRTPTAALPAELGGTTLTAGVYQASAATALTGTVTLDGQGDPNSLFVFQLGAALATAAASHVNLINGAKAGHVFWQVTGAAGTGAASSFAGTIMASGAITIGAGAQLIGRALSYGTVTLANNAISFSTSPPPMVTISGGSAVETVDTTPTITGTTDAVAGATVTVKLAGQVLTGLVGAGGSWNVTAAAIFAGTYVVTASVRNQAGDIGTANQTLTINVNPTPPSLGAAGPFSVLAATGVSSAGATAVSGDLGVSPSNSVVGFPPGTVGGTIHAGDATAQSGQSALTAAFNQVAALRPSDSFAGEMGGLTFDDGVHQAVGAVSLTGTVTLDARGDPNAVFVFQLGAALATAAASQVSLVNGAQASNVFWQVNAAVGTGASSLFAGTIMASGAITLGAGAQLLGRALSFGTVTLSTNAIRFTSALPPTVAIDGGPTAVAETTTPTITGTSNVGAGTAVVVNVAGQQLTTTVQTNGTWSVTAANLTGGAHAVVASVQDTAGNGDNATQSLTIELNPVPPALGLAGSFSVLAGTGVTSSGATVISGDLGVSPSNSVVGFPPGTVNGTVYAGDSSAASAQSALVTAYNDAASRTPTADIAGALAGLTFDDGVYHAASAATLAGTLTLDGRGDPNATFVFQLDAGLATAAASQLNLIGGAQASHVFWQVNGAVGTGASSLFAGTMLASGAITLGAGTQLVGRALGTGAITLSANPVTFSSGAAPNLTITGGASVETFDTTPTIAGTTGAPPGATVTVRIASQQLATTVAADGTWNVTAADLPAGTYTLTVSVRNAAGDAGTASQRHANAGRHRHHHHGDLHSDLRCVLPYEWPARTCHCV